MDEHFTRLSEALIRVMNKVVRNEKTPRKFGVDALLYPSEIHMIMFIGNNEGVHMSELARIVGVTRGAVSQSVTKLEEKGLARKSGDPDNHLKAVPVLTQKGRVAYLAHEQHHKQMDNELYKYMKQLSKKDLKLIEGFLTHLENMVDKHK